MLVLSNWAYNFEDGFLKDTYRDPAVSWDGPFLGGEDIWPEALRAPARAAFESTQNHKIYHMCVDFSCGYILSWEPI